MFSFNIFTARGVRANTKRGHKKILLKTSRHSADGFQMNIQSEKEERGVAKKAVPKFPQEKRYTITKP
jgi:hypothetical protein